MITMAKYQSPSPKKATRSFAVRVVKVFFRGDNAFYILSAAITEHPDEKCVGNVVTCKGTFRGNVTPNATFSIEGYPSFNKARNEWQMSVTKATEVVSQSRLWLRVLKRVPGIGERRAMEIARQLGDVTLEEIAKSPLALRKLDIKGLQPDTIGEIYNAIKSHSEESYFLKTLYSLDLTDRQIAVIQDTFGRSSLTELRERCYELTSVPGFGFLTVDRIGQAIGVPAKDTYRIKSGLLFAASKCLDNGSTCFEMGDVLKEASKLLGVLPDSLKDQFTDLIKEELIVSEETDVSDKSELLPNDAKTC